MNLYSTTESDVRSFAGRHDVSNTDRLRRGFTAATSCGSARPGCLGYACPMRSELEAEGALRLCRAESRRPGVIQIWLAGGPATIDMWDLKPEAPEEIRGEFRPIATSAPGVVDLRAHAGAGEGDGPLHAGPFARPHDQRPRPGHDLHGHGQSAGPGAGISRGGIAGGRGCCRRGRASRPTSRSPRFETAFRHRARLPRPGVRPVRGRGRPARGHAPVARGVAPEGFSLARPGVSRGAAGPVRPRPASARIGGCDRRASTASIARRWRSSGPTGSALRSTCRASPKPLRDDYGRTTAGPGALAARRLIEAGARFVTLGFGGWDTHGDNFRHLRQPPPAAAGQGARGAGPRP